MKLTNDSYIILICAKNVTERYYRDKAWLKISARGRKFRLTAEQVLNHVLPAVAGIKPNLTIKVEHQDHASRMNELPDIKTACKFSPTHFATLRLGVRFKFSFPTPKLNLRAPGASLCLSSRGF